MKEKAKIVTAAVVSAAAVGVMSAGVLAYLTDATEVTNTFTIGDVEIELTEPNYDSSLYTALMPTQTVIKDPTVTNTGNADAYIKVDVMIPTYPDGISVVNDAGAIDTAYDLFTYEVNNGWELYGSPQQVANPSGGYYMQYSYLYEEALGASESTPAVFSEVVLANITDNQDIVGATVDIPIYAYAIQAEGLDLDTAFDAYDAQTTT